MSKAFEMIHDPYEKHSSFDIKRNPPGKRLYWASIVRIRREGWRGWIPVQKGDGVYERLDEYINDSPLKYMRNVDKTVIRGQNILCWMPLGMAIARKKAAAERANAGIHRSQREIANIPPAAGAWGEGIKIRSQSADPTSVDVIMKSMGVTEDDLAHPDADPRNYKYMAEAALPSADSTSLPGEGEPPKRKRGRPRKVPLEG